MTQLRLIQNFGGMRALVAGTATPLLQGGLERLGLRVECLDEAAPGAPILDPERDVLLLDGDAGLPAPLLARAGEQALPVPVLGMVGIETPGRMRMLMRAGATAFLRKPVQGGTLYAALFLGINTFRERRAAETRLAEHERRRRGRRYVIRAVLQVMQRHELDDEAAYERLRRAAMRARAGIEDYCEAWLQELEQPCSVEQERESMGRHLHGAALSVLLALSAAAAASAAEPIKLGVLEDQSGDFAIATIGKVHGIQLATDEINAKGGIAGRPIQLVIYDTQSDNTRYQQFMRRVLQRDKVDVVFAGFSSASREAYRPIVDQLDGFAFYNNQYEGGVCDSHMIVTGAVPEQQFSTLIPWMMDKFGKHFYTIAADYNFGQISAEWVRNIVKQQGGTMSGEEFIPLGVSQFSQTIQNIQKAKPDVLMTLLVGTAQSSYYGQAHAAGLTVPMGSSVNVGQGYEHKRFPAPTLANMYVTTNYIEEVPTPASKAFVARWHVKFPNEPYVNQEAENSYAAVYLYKQMVERANGSTKRSDIRAVIAKGDVCLDAPEGKMCIDPKSQHTSHTIYLAKVNEDHSISFPKIWPDVKPYWLGENGCDLTKSDPETQYTPSNPPPKR